VNWKVEVESQAEAQLIADFRAGALDRDDVAALKAWVRDVESDGLPAAQGNGTWRDHELTRPPFVGCRSACFSKSGRVIYKEMCGKLIVMVVKVTRDHRYQE
jgi:hypothetical protein